jgi:hypothetical protein
MDGDHFDQLVRTLASRRQLGAVAVALLDIAKSEASAQARHHHHHGPPPCTGQMCFGRCIPSFSVCCSNPAGNSCPLNNTCCPPNAPFPAGYCAATPNAVCCTREGGGWCFSGDTCCPPSPGAPQGLCVRGLNAICCGSGSCVPGQKCCPANADHPNEFCAGEPNAVCCSSSGTWCFAGERCCPPTRLHPEGLCIPVNQACSSFVAAASRSDERIHRQGVAHPPVQDQVRPAQTATERRMRGRRAT